MIAQTLGDAAFTEGEIYGEVYSGNLGVNEGMVMENYVAQALAAKGRRLFFYSRYDLEHSANRMEVDFLVRRGDKISPVEVKSGKSLSHTSLDKFRAKFGRFVGEPFILSTRDVALKDGITYLPLYMAGCL